MQGPPRLMFLLDSVGRGLLQTCCSCVGTYPARLTKNSMTDAISLPHLFTRSHNTSRQNSSPNKPRIKGASHLELVVLVSWHSIGTSPLQIEGDPMPGGATLMGSSIMRHVRERKEKEKKLTRLVTNTPSTSVWIFQKRPQCLEKRIQLPALAVSLIVVKRHAIQA
ncbi:uncharacterized protein CEXT_423741 [Caerostris extrusa]|uniref:Secreted protein n=1 Tax=Caerostris extrusa TaxID=172846 RepID=A0AAV4Y1K8_CAEEX|nr:uncharacterized protein CEXT_423741 [Caerostris extrusa]